jgi:hypothetical protein
MTESDAAVAQMAQTANVAAGPGNDAVRPASAGQSVETQDAVATIMDMLGKGV